MALELVTQERNSGVKENQNLLQDLLDVQGQLTRKQAQCHELVKNENKLKEQLQYEDARFQKINASYNTIKSTLTALLQNQEPASTVASTSDSAVLNTLTTLQKELHTEKLQRQLLVSRFMTQKAQHEAKVKELKQELAQAKGELEIQKQRNEALSKEKEAVGSLASTAQTSQAEIHLHVHLPPMPDMPNLPGTSQHDEEHQGPAPGALDVRGDIEQNIEDMPKGPVKKEFLLHEKKVMESAALAHLQPKEQVKGLGHDFLPLPLMKHEAILWKEKMRPALQKNEEGGYEGIPLIVEQAQALIEDHPKWQKKWLQDRPMDLTNFHNTPQALQIDPTYYPVPHKRTWLEFQRWKGLGFVTDFWFWICYWFSSADLVHWSETVLSLFIGLDWLVVQVLGSSGLLVSRSLAEVQEVERYILAAREKEIESLRKAEQRRATLAKAPMTSANPLQSPELTTLKSQPTGSHIASGSKDTPNASILDGVFLNENWEYNLQTEKLTDLYTSYTYHVGWLDVIQATSNSTSVDEQQRMICDVIHSIVQMERQNLGINMPSMGPMRFLDTTKAKQPTISQMETPSVNPMDPSYIVSPGVSMQSESTHGSFSFLDLVQPSLGDLPTPTMNMTRDAPSTSLASTTPLHTSVAPMPIPVGVHQPYVPVATHPYVAPMSPPNPITYVPQSHYPSPYFSRAVPAGINTSYSTSAIPEPTSTSFRPSLGAVPYEVWDPRRVCMPRSKPANPFPYVVPRVPTPVASTPIMPTHLGDLEAFAQTIDRSIVENMHNLPDREPSSKAVQVAKIAQKYNGDGDFRKHVKIFEQVCDSLGEYNDSNRCRALSLTLSEKAEDWYRTLRMEEKTIYPILLLKEYIREGVLWGVASQLQKAKREDGESVRDFISRLKNLNSQCALNEHFNNNQLLDRFIRGLHHENIYNGLIIRGITTWEAITTNAIELEDNLMIAEERISSDTEPTNPQASRHEPMTIKPIVKEPKIADMTLMDLTKAIQESLKVNQVPQNTHMYPRREQQWCSICFGTHSTSECPTFRAKFNGVCHICGKYGHQAKDCLMLKRMMVTNRPSLPWTDSPRVLALMPAPPIEQPS
ncbi:hypothetical protein L7F22_014817 [Adiantum nelumboides]|nr:hypothetical protein [Adiantum nelumboides]